MEYDAQALERFRLKLRYKVCYHLGSFCPDVDDVVQEALARFVTALRDNKILNPASAGSYLSGVCNNVILEYRRRLWHDLTDLETAPPSPLVPPEADTYETRDSITAAMAQLSDRDCEILRAFYLEEREKDEICGTMGLSDTQFRVTLFRAKDRFRKIYRQGVKQTASGGH